MERVRKLMRRGVVEGVFPGGVLLVGNGDAVVFHEAFGRADLWDGSPVTTETVFDLASLTKPLATTLAVVKLAMVNPDIMTAPVADLLRPSLSPRPFSIGKATVAHLLSHTSGLPAHRPYYLEMVKIPPTKRRRWLLSALLGEPLLHPVGEKTLYSDLGFMLLQSIVESLTRTHLDRLLRKAVYGPLNLESSLFFPRPDLMRRRRFAATEQCPWRGKPMKGEVHDENAWALGGVAGHAGLFGTASGVYLMLRHLLIVRDTPELVHSPFSPRLIRAFLEPYKESGRALGFDMPSPVGSSCGRYFSANSVGHLGFTGTSFWIDLDRKALVVLLTNRVHPSRRNLRIRGFRPMLHDTIMRALQE